MKSDLHQISPCNIDTISNKMVMRIKDMIKQDEFAWYFNKFSPLPLEEMRRGKKMRISIEMLGFLITNKTVTRNEQKS